MEIKFKTVLDLIYNDDNLEKLKAEIEKINNGVLEMKFTTADDGKEMVGSNLVFETWYYYNLDKNISKIGVNIAWKIDIPQLLIAVK